MRCLTNAGGRVAFSADGRTLATGNWDDVIRLWDFPECRLRQTLTGGFRLLAMELSPDGRFLATVTWDSGLQLWSVPESLGLFTR